MITRMRPLGSLLQARPNTVRLRRVPGACALHGRVVPPGTWAGRYQLLSDGAQVRWRDRTFGILLYVHNVPCTTCAPNGHGTQQARAWLVAQLAPCTRARSTILRIRTTEDSSALALRCAHGGFGIWPLCLAARFCPRSAAVCHMPRQPRGSPVVMCEWPQDIDSCSLPRPPMATQQGWWPKLRGSHGHQRHRVDDTLRRTHCNN